MSLKLSMLTIAACSISSAYAANASFMGNEIGVAKCKNTVESLSSKVSMNKTDTLKEYPDGTRYVGNADNLGLKGAKRLILICDNSDILISVLIDIDKGDNFQSYQKTLKAKYKQVKLINPFVGDHYAEYTKGSSTIILTAPHLSFEMQLIYATNGFIKRMYEVAKKEQNDKNNYQQNAL